MSKKGKLGYDTSVFIEKAKKVHGNRFSYENTVYKGRGEKVEIICKEHGSYWQIAGDHLMGKKCPKCALLERASKRTHSNNWFIEKAKSIHGDKYRYDKSVYKGWEKEVTIYCHTHGYFSQLAGNHIKGEGCPKCANYDRVSWKRDSVSSFVEKAKRLHGDKYDYSLITEYKNTYSKVPIICKEHGVFIQTANSHLNGCGCPSCGVESYKKPICGIGITDIPCTMNANKGDLAYHTWSGMIKRCYGKNKIYRCWSNCTVCEEWHRYSNFKKWYEENVPIGYQIDKDFLQHGVKNKVYSPDTCIALPSKLNSLITKCDRSRGKYLIGVSKLGNLYYSKLNMNKKHIPLGSFDDEYSAFIAYKKAKEKYIKEVANDYFSKGLISEKARNAMCAYEVYETD